MTTDEHLSRWAGLRTLPSNSADHRVTVIGLRSVGQWAITFEAEAAELESCHEELVDA